MNDETGILQAAGGVRQVGSSWDVDFENSLGRLADYENRRLNFTEEKLIQRINEYLPLIETHNSGEFESIPDFFTGDMCVGFEHWNTHNQYGTESNIANGIAMSFSDYIPEMPDTIQNPGAIADEALTMVPVYNELGGVTATVTVFGAINANSKRAEDAFLILDYLLSADGQSRSGFARRFMEHAAIPVYDDLMQEDTYISSVYGNWYLIDGNYAEFCHLREQITTVRIAGQLEQELHSMAQECFASAINGRTEEYGTVEEIVHDTYSRMQKEISE